MVVKIKWPLVEVIILNINNKWILRDCLNSLRKSSYKNLKITVVDQNSIDGSIEMIEEDFKEVYLEKNKDNNGFVGGNNQILSKSNAKYCILLNEDTTQEMDWIERLVEIAEGDDKIAALQPKVRSLRNKKYFEYAGAGGGFIDRYGYEFCRGRIFFDVEEDVGQYNDFVETFWTCGVAMFLRRSVLERIGYLDESFFMYYEETDLSWRMNLAGYKQVYVPTSVIYHLGNSILGNLKDTFTFNKIFFLHRNGWVTVLKNYSRESWIRVITQKFFIEMVAIIRYSLHQPKRSLAIIYANLWVFFNIGKIIKKNRKVQGLRVVSDRKIIEKMSSKSVVWSYFIRGERKFDYYQQKIKSFREYK